MGKFAVGDGRYRNKFAVGDGRHRGPYSKTVAEKQAALDLSGTSSCIHGHSLTAENAYTNNGWKACKTCRNMHSREQKRKHKAAIRWYKSTHPCTDCGEADPVVLEFDHLGGKDFNLSTGGSRSLTLVIAEIQKCEVVCANCHRRRTAVRGDF
jgi:hypothetical protein